MLCGLMANMHVRLKITSMPLQICLVLTCLIALSTAHPYPLAARSPSTPNPASILKRALPQFQKFPVGSPNVGRIQQAYKDMASIVNYIFQNIDSNGDRAQRIYLKYFDIEDHPKVTDILRAMVEPAKSDPGSGADTLSRIVINSDDTDPEGCHERGTAAYTKCGNDKPTQVHICQQEDLDAYAYPDLSKIGCGDLDKNVSPKMMTLGGSVLLHELVHTPEVSRSILENVVKNRGIHWTGDYAYGPTQVLQLKQGLLNDQVKQQGIDPLPKPFENADSYAWYATELYWSLKCNHDYDPTDDSNDVMVPGLCKGNDQLMQAVFLCHFDDP